MQDLVFLQKEQALTTSLKVAEVFGKEHFHVVRDIRNLIKEMASASQKSNLKGVSPNLETPPMFQETTYIHEQNNQEYPMYLINRDGFTLLAMGFNGKKALQFKLAYIDAFNKMEQALITLAAERKVLRDSTKKGYRKLTDSIKANVIPIARANGSITDDKFFYINGANMLNSILGCKPYSRDKLSLTQMNMLDQLQDIARLEYKQAAKIYHDVKQINAYVKDKLTVVSQILSVPQRLELK